MIAASTFIFYACKTSAPGEANRHDDSSLQKKIVFISGGPSHGKGEHEFQGGCKLLAGMLNDNIKNLKAIVYDNGWPTESSVLADADAIVVYCDGGEGHMIIPYLQEVDKLMKKGKGLVLIHYAVELPKGEKGNYFINWVGGNFETHWSVNPYWKPKYATLPKHPVTRGVKPFEVEDEWYYHIRFAEGMKNITPILVTLPHKSTLDRPDGTHENNPYVREDIAKGIPQIMAWAIQRPDGGRGFGFTGGHMHINWMNDDFRKIVLNAIVWAAKIDVPENGVKSITPTQNEMDELSK